MKQLKLLVCAERAASQLHGHMFAKRLQFNLYLIDIASQSQPRLTVRGWLLGHAG